MIQILIVRKYYKITLINRFDISIDSALRNGGLSFHQYKSSMDISNMHPRLTVIPALLLFHLPLTVKLEREQEIRLTQSFTGLTKNLVTFLFYY